MDLDTVADELYRLRPEEFTAARAARVAAARTAGDRALADRIAELRRPSLSAWAGNLLVHERHEEVEPLIRLGEGLRQAHHDLDGAKLRELSRQQRALIGTLSRQAAQLAARAGHPITEAARQEVEGTLRAVLADPEAAREWATGRLVKPLTADAGFPAAPEAGLAAKRRPAAPDTTKKATAERRRRLTQARKEADEAARELRTREKEAATATREAFAAKKRWNDAQQRVGDLTAELQRAKDEQQQARSAERTARDHARTADRRLREARRRAESTAEAVTANEE
ncbi:hypothetical protein [Streptomyces lanatus]|uniref:Transposase n=1 Tax=Streptomyces lanatus TaxID=66900 RepID=A0ABV1XSV4_9ACTN|nr:hypothetical protein [Streptomyces lanatus]GHH07472.1 hypothetical protein GCM10018780_41350 [Streptomyces lanatus]